MLRVGQNIDRYCIEALIGQGGMAAVYRAKHTRLNSLHAIKVVYITAPIIRERLIREGRVQANLRHPNVVSVTDVLQVDGAPALVMEYVSGPSLDDWLKQQHATIPEALFLFRGILRGVMTAHDRGVIHRDLKPANVLLAPTNDGYVPKVTDFGLVKSLSEDRGNTQTGLALGTPEYMAPEQIRDSSEVDARADLFALGCILYEMVCHRRCFKHGDKMATFTAIVNGDYIHPRELNPDLPRNIIEAIRWCLEPNRDQRLSSCQELFDLLYDDAAIGALRAPTDESGFIEISGQSSFSDSQPAPVVSRDPLFATAPTGKPAKQRQFPMVTGMSEPPPTPISSPVVRWILPATALLAILLLGIGLGSLWSRQSRDERLAPPETIASPNRLSSDTPTPAQQPEPQPEPPPTVEPKPAPPAPQPKTVVAPSPPIPKPKTPEISEKRPPAPKKPEPAPTEAEPPAMGAVSVSGDASGVSLRANGKRFRPAQPLPANTYRVFANFGDGLISAGSVSIQSGQTTKLVCTAFLQSCRQQ